MDVIMRVEKATACDVINLTEPEKDIYCGSGWKLARFIDGVLIEFFDPLETKYQADIQAMANEAMENAVAWIEKYEEVWLVMCSCYQLCEPQRITLLDAAALAKMARVFSEQFEEM